MVAASSSGSASCTGPGEVAEVLVPGERVERWVENFRLRHGGATLDVGAGALRGLAGDGSSFVARLPLDATYDGGPDPAALAARVLGFREP